MHAYLAFGCTCASVRGKCAVCAKRRYGRDGRPASAAQLSACWGVRMHSRLNVHVCVCDVQVRQEVEELLQGDLASLLQDSEVERSRPGWPASRIVAPTPDKQQVRVSHHRAHGGRAAGGGAWQTAVGDCHITALVADELQVGDPTFQT